MVLIESVQFTPSPDKEIEWKTQGIAKPSIGGDYQLPIIVRSIV